MKPILHNGELVAAHPAATAWMTVHRLNEELHEA